MEPGQIYELFGRRVVGARASAQITQQALAEMVGLSRASIANIEAGRQRVVLHQALEIAEALRVSSVEELLPTDLILGRSTSEPNPKIKLSGSTVSKSEADAIAQIVANT